MADASHPYAIRQIEVVGLHGLYTINLKLSPDVNILHGDNGSGKTTLLHIISNIIEPDIKRFIYLKFAHIHITTYAGQTLLLARVVLDGIETLVLRLNDAKPIYLNANSEQPEQLRNDIRSVFGGRPLYLPAFRGVLEAAVDATRTYTRPIGDTEESEFQSVMQLERRAQEERISSAKRGYWLGRERRSSEQAAYKTLMCRRWFGRFVPIIRTPALDEIADATMSEWRDAQLSIAEQDRAALSELFINVLQAALSQQDGQEGWRERSIATEGQIEHLLDGIRVRLLQLERTLATLPQEYTRLAGMVNSLQKSTKDRGAIIRVLSVYASMLETRLAARESVLAEVTSFARSASRFLTRKMFDYSTAERRSSKYAKILRIASGDLRSLKILSSGERHVLTLLFSATHMSPGDGPILVDEPEISLHVDWQRRIIKEMIKQTGGRQIIVCTHSPEIAEPFDSGIAKMTLMPWDNPQRQNLFPNEENTESAE